MDEFDDKKKIAMDIHRRIHSDGVVIMMRSQPGYNLKDIMDPFFTSVAIDTTALYKECRVGFKRSFSSL
jgi:hypothetical protein